jgi:hypothetical protein
MANLVNEWLVYTFSTAASRPKEWSKVMPEVDVEIERRTRKSRQNQGKFPEKLPRDWLTPVTLTGHVTVLKPPLPSQVSPERPREAGAESGKKEDAELDGVALGDSVGSGTTPVVTDQDGNV